MNWKLPPPIKVYEALGCLADKRITVKDNTATVHSSSKGKYYTVTYDQDQNAIMANDNGSYWKGYLGYPSIAFLLSKQIISFRQKFTEPLKGILWKDLKIKFGNDFDKTIAYVDALIQKQGIDLSEFKKEVNDILAQIDKLNLKVLGSKVKPPEGY